MHVVLRTTVHEKLTTQQICTQVRQYHQPNSLNALLAGQLLDTKIHDKLEKKEDKHIRSAILQIFLSALEGAFLSKNFLSGRVILFWIHLVERLDL